MFNRAPILDSITASDVKAIGLHRPIQSNANAQDALLSLDSSLLKLESVLWSDVHSVVIDKAPFEDSVVIDNPIYNYLHKPFVETLSNTELTLFDVTKVNEDIVNTIESIRFSLLSTISDQSSVNDVLSNAMSKIADDEMVAFSETLFKKDIALLIKEEDYYLSDYFLEDYFFKAVHATDQITDVQFAKNIVDVVDATDDFYGALNVDDDQTASVHKILVTWVSNSDTFSRIVQFYRVFNDTSNTSEVIANVFGKVLSDTTTAIT